MANFTVTPNMNLIVPNPANANNPETGPQYAADQNQDLLIIDLHNHSPGSGVQITPTGLNINANLNFQGNIPYNVYGVQFSNPASSARLSFLYTNAQSGGGIDDLFFNDGAGNVIPLTKAGTVNATLASIPGESYAGGTFTWKQGAGSTTPANFDIGSITIRPNIAATANGVVLGPPASISSQYNLQLPTIPGATSFMTLDTSGNMSTGPAITGGLTTSNLSASAGILGTQIANHTLTQILKAPMTTSATATAGNFAVTTSCGISPNNAPFTVFTLTLATTGRPVQLGMMSDGTSGSSFLSPPGGGSVQVQYKNNGTLLTNYQLSVGPIPTSAFTYVDTTVIGAPATYTYTLVLSPSGGTTTIQYSVMYAYEI